MRPHPGQRTSPIEPSAVREGPVGKGPAEHPPDQPSALGARRPDVHVDHRFARWDTADPGDAEHLSHAVPCPACGHEAHRFLPCSDTCACEPPALPWLPAPDAA